MRRSLAVLIAVGLIALFAITTAPPLSPEAQPAMHAQTVGFGATMSSMPGAQAYLQPAEVQPGTTNAGHQKLTGSFLGLIFFGLFLAVNLATRPRAFPLRQSREVSGGVGIGEVASG